MSLFSLPLEIFLHITGYIDKTGDFLALISSTRCTYGLFKSELYRRHVVATGGRGLQMYAERGMAQGVRDMLAAGAKVDLDDDGATPLLLATRERHAHIVKLLLENGASPNHRSPEVPLCEAMVNAVLFHGFEIPKLLLDYGADINLTQEDEDGLQESPLHVAAQGRGLDALKFLIDRGADVQFGTQDGDESISVLHRVLDGLEENEPFNKQMLRDVITLLVNEGVDVDCVDDDDSTPLMMAASVGCVDAVQAFLDCGADVNFQVRHNDDWRRPTALHHAVKACRGDPVEVMKLLIDHGADVYAIDSVYGTPLHTTCLGPTQLLLKSQILLDHGSDLQALDVEGWTILHWHAKEFECEAIKWACQHGLDVNTKGFFGDTPLHSMYEESCMSKELMRVATAQVLIDLGADVNIENSRGVTPLLLASGSRDVESMRLLLDHGAKVNHRDHTGLTPLHWAAGGFHIVCIGLTTSNPNAPYSGAIALLLERGAEINAKSIDGVTPREISEERQNLEAVLCLTEAGGI